MLTINEFDICYPLLFFSFGYFYHIQPTALALNLKARIPSQIIHANSNFERVKLRQMDQVSKWYCFGWMGMKCTG